MQLGWHNEQTADTLMSIQYTSLKKKKWQAVLKKDITLKRLLLQSEKSSERTFFPEFSPARSFKEQSTVGCYLRSRICSRTISQSSGAVLSDKCTFLSLSLSRSPGLYGFLFLFLLLSSTPFRWSSQCSRSGLESDFPSQSIGSPSAMQPNITE